MSWPIEREMARNEGWPIEGALLWIEGWPFEFVWVGAIFCTADLRFAAWKMNGRN